MPHTDTHNSRRYLLVLYESVPGAFDDVPRVFAGFVAAGTIDAFAVHPHVARSRDGLSDTAIAAQTPQLAHEFAPSPARARRRVCGKRVRSGGIVVHRA